MRKVYIATKEELNEIVDGTPVGRVVFDYVLRDGYVKANGATVADASVNYPRLVAFIREHSELLTEDVAANPELYAYNLADDVLTLPNLMGRVLQGGDKVVSVNAGLPNITGVNDVYYVGQHEPGQCTYDKTNDMYIRGTGAIRCYSGNASYLRNRGMSTNADNTRILFGYSDFDASRSNAIYGASTTVQPPAVKLIPQIRY